VKPPKANTDNANAQQNMGLSTFELEIHAMERNADSTRRFGVGERCGSFSLRRLAEKDAALRCQDGI
jgi:hypothetical protein